jgi:hypothetical protein
MSMDTHETPLQSRYLVDYEPGNVCLTSYKRCHVALTTHPHFSDLYFATYKHEKTHNKVELV